MMKVRLYEKYGPPEVLKITEVEKPTPKENELLVKVHSTIISFGTMIARSGKHPDSKFFTFTSRLIFGIRKPRRNILDYELAGEIKEVETNVELFKKGEQIFGTTSGLKFGAYADYVCITEEWEKGVVAIKPVNLSYEEAATIPQSAIAALQGLRNKKQILRFKPGQKVLVNGAGEGMGSFAVQIAKYFGAEVTSVDNSEKLDMLHSINSDHVIDYTQEDFTKSGKKYDLILDVQTHHSICAYKRSLNPKGIYKMVGGSGKAILQTLYYAGFGLIQLNN